jgi:acyl-CoA synthetase (AMP-forming)/AMP-acid ligase II
MITLSLPETNVEIPIRADALITNTSGVLPHVGSVVRADLSWMEGEGRPLDAHLLPSTHEDDYCRIVLSSTAGGNLQAIAISHKLLTARINHSLIVSGSRLANCSRIYSDFALASALGFQFLIYTLWRGGTAFFPGDNFPNTLRGIEDYKVQCLAGSPQGLEHLLRWFDTVPSYQSSIEVLFCAGDVLPPPLSLQLRSRICSHLVTAYTTGEAGISAAAGAHEVADVPGAVGFATPGVTIQVVDASNTLLPPLEEGAVRIRSGYAVNGYFGDPDEASKVFRDGWFYPGDLGALNAEGLLMITKRRNVG